METYQSAGGDTIKLWKGSKGAMIQNTRTLDITIQLDQSEDTFGAASIEDGLELIGFGHGE